MTTWAVILAVGAGSYLLRALPLHLDGRGFDSARFERVIGQAGTAALTALVVGGLHRTTTSPTQTAATVAAAAAALALAVRGWSMLRVLAVGTATYATTLAAAALLG
jgi:branched-subunit amino acid transport protein